MRVSIVPAQVCLPIDAARLGRFVTSVEHPHQNYHDPHLASEPCALVGVRDSFTGEHHASIDSGFSSTLTSLVSAGLSKRNKTTIRIATDRTKTYTLDNSDRWFEEAARLNATRVWIERAVDRGQNIYMIVGLHTITNARMSQELVVDRNVGGQINAPVNLALAATGVVLPFGNAIEPGIAVHQQGLDGSHLQFTVPGEQICALEYRKLSHKWLSSKHIDNFQLSTKVCQWQTMERTRDDEDGEDDIVEIELTEVHGLSGRWVKETLEDRIILMSSDGTDEPYVDSN